MPRASRSSKKRGNARISGEGIGVWTKAEHERFLEAQKLHPNGPWKLVAEFVGTRSTRQTMTHAQKYRQKLARRLRGLRTSRKLSSVDDDSNTVSHVALLHSMGGDLESVDGEEDDNADAMEPITGGKENVTPVMAVNTPTTTIKNSFSNSPVEVEAEFLDHPFISVAYSEFDELLSEECSALDFDVQACYPIEHTAIGSLPLSMFDAPLDGSMTKFLTETELPRLDDCLDFIIHTFS